MSDKSNRSKAYAELNRTRSQIALFQKAEIGILRVMKLLLQAFMQDFILHSYSHKSVLRYFNPESGNNTAIVLP